MAVNVATQVLTGRNGELYDDQGNFLAEVNQFQVRLNFNNVRWRPAGSPLEVAIPDIVTVTLTFQETVVRDAVLLQRLIDALKTRGQVVFAHFQGVIRGRDGTEGRYVLRSCVPDGNIDLVNVRPGDVITREWSFHCNELPDIQRLLGVA